MVMYSHLALHSILIQKVEVKLTGRRLFVAFEITKAKLFKKNTLTQRNHNMLKKVNKHR
jgi:hypothetical protein